jgi:hypothetical protein
MNATVFVGCSFTKGEGLPKERTDPDLWVNRLHQLVPVLNSTELINLAQGGNNNETIFHDAVNSLADSPRYLFVVWTVFPRIRINPGVELYNTTQNWSPATELVDLHLHRLNYSKKYLVDIKNRFFDLLHDHYEIVKVLRYSQTVARLGQVTDTKIFFVNGLLPWDNNYFTEVLHTQPSNTTRYTQSILDADTRDDAEYWGIYNKIHSDYRSAGLPDHNWINLYQGYQQNFVLDLGTDNLHPGPISNRSFSDFLIKKLDFDNI